MDQIHRMQSGALTAMNPQVPGLIVAADVLAMWQRQRHRRRLEAWEADATT